MAIIYDNYIDGTGNGPTWHVKIRPPSRIVRPYYRETALAAELIWEKKLGKIHVCLSGGMDSEYALAVFQSLGMEAIPVILRTKYNAHDIKYAFKYCENNNLSPIVIDLDFDYFVKSGQFLDIATKTNCAAYQYIATMWLTNLIGGTVITGETDPHLYLGKDGKWYVDEIEPFDFRPEYIDELKTLQVEGISNPARYFLIAAKGDELLDWKEMVEFYKGAKQLVLEGSDHGIADYADHLPEVLEFISPR